MKLYSSLIFILITCASLHAQEIENSNDKNYILDYDVFQNTDFGKVKTIVSGEIHRNSANQKVVFDLIKYLNTNHDVQYLGLELSYSAGLTINRCLEIGDTIHLKNMLTEMTWPAVFPTKEYQTFFIELSGWNQSHPERTPIKILGFDIDYHLMSSIEYLNYILEHFPHEQNESYKSKMDLVHDLESNLDDLKYITGAITTFLKNQSLPSESNAVSHPKHHVDFQIILENMLQCNETNADYVNGEWDKYRSKGIARDEHMYRNLVKLQSMLKIDKVYLHMGIYHLDSKKSVLSELKKDRDTNELLVLGFGYSNCEIAGKDEIIEIKKDGLRSYMKNSENDIAIFKAQQDEKMFKTIPYDNRFKILIRNQPASILNN